MGVGVGVERKGKEGKKKKAPPRIENPRFPGKYQAWGVAGGTGTTPRSTMCPSPL